MKILNAFVMALLLAAAQSAWAGNLVTVEWLQKNLGREEVLVIDTSPTRAYAAKHIPGAISVDLFATALFGDASAPEIERRFQSFGIDTGRTIVIHDEGASWTAPWLFAELHYHGFPTDRLFVLDGGLAKWEASGGALTKEASPAPGKGGFRITATRPEERTLLAQFLVASGDRANHVLVDALEAPYYYGGAKFFDRAGHVPNAVSLPVSELYNADKTFKSAEELRRMADYHGISREQQIHSHCGGGGAAAAPYFAFKFVAGYPKVTVYKGSQREWLMDERGLPLWTYGAPFLKRDASWVNGWNARMMRMFGMTQMSIVDVRPAEAFARNHVPFAVNVPADVFRNHVDDPAKLAKVLAAAGVNPAHEAVIVSTGGVNDGAALAFAMLEKLGQKKVSLLADSVDDWGLRGFELTREPTIVGPPSPKAYFVTPTKYAAEPRAGVVIKDARSTTGTYPKVYLASGKQVPGKSPQGKVVHVPYTELVNADGKPKAASEISGILSKAGVPRYAEIICFSDDPGEAAVNYFVMKLMGFPDVKVLVDV